MKKKVLYLFLSLILMMTLTGCVKFNANMDIKKDKSMDFSIVYAVDTTYFGDEDLLDSTDKAELKKEGYTIEEYSKDTMKGYTVSRSIKNIDKVSTSKDIVYNLSEIFGENSEENMFKVKKGFLKNTYIVSFKFDSSDSGLTDTEEDSEDDFEDDYTINESDDGMSDFTDSISSGMDLSFNVTLPYSALSNNAKTTKNDDKVLSWSLASDEVEKINFSFEIYNMNNIYISAGGLFILLVILIVKINRSRRNRFLASVYDEIGTKINIDKPAQAKVSRAPSSSNEENTSHSNVQRL